MRARPRRTLLVFCLTPCSLANALGVQRPILQWRSLWSERFSLASLSWLALKPFPRHAHRRHRRLAWCWSQRPTRWAARCDTGCRWQRLSFWLRARLSCRGRCLNGVATVATPYLDSASFSFIVERTDHGVRATSRAGTAWQALSWKCQLDPCRAQSEHVRRVRDRYCSLTTNER